MQESLAGANRVLGGLALTLVPLIPGCTSPAAEPDWVRLFEYAPEDVHSVEVGEFGYPYVAVEIAGTHLMLPFDTGNMVGVSVSSELFNQTGLTEDSTHDQLNSAGETVASLRVADAVNTTVLGRDLGPTRVFEVDFPRLPGLMGPVVVGGGHFTLDYESRRIALGNAKLPDAVPGFRQLPLVRSSRHPMLILVQGAIEGRNVLLELDTGKSRTVINPALATDLALKRGPRGVAIGNLRIGDLLFEVPSAKEVDQTAIDPALPEPILAGVGSDILSRFVWTVDYEAGRLWIPASQ